MKEKLKKYIMPCILIISLALNIYIYIYASEDNHILSRGKVVFDNNTIQTDDDVIFDADDFNILEDTINNKLVEVFKQGEESGESKAKIDTNNFLNNEPISNSAISYPTYGSWDGIAECTTNLEKGKYLVFAYGYVKSWSGTVVSLSQNKCMQNLQMKNGGTIRKVRDLYSVASNNSQYMLGSVYVVESEDDIVLYAYNTITGDSETRNGYIVEVYCYKID